MASLRLLALALMFVMGTAQNQTELQYVTQLIQDLRISQTSFQSLMQATLSSAGYTVCRTYTDKMQEVKVEMGKLKSDLSQQMKTSAMACRSEFKLQTEDLKAYMQELLANMTDNTKCGTGYHAYEGSCYMLVQNEISWMTAKKRCESVGAKLVSIESKEKNDFLEKLVQSFFNVDTVMYGQMDIWTAGNDLEKEGTWQWASTGKLIKPGVTYTNWKGGKPKKGLLVTDCLLLQVKEGTSTWYDRACATNANYICEKEA